MGRAFDKYFSLIVTVAIIAVIVSRNARTAEVLRTMGATMSSILGSIVAPVSGGGSSNGENGNG